MANMVDEFMRQHLLNCVMLGLGVRKQLYISVSLFCATVMVAVVAHACDSSSIWEVEARVQGHPWLYNESKANPTLKT